MVFIDRSQHQISPDTLIHTGQQTGRLTYLNFNPPMRGIFVLLAQLIRWAISSAFRNLSTVAVVFCIEPPLL